VTHLSGGDARFRADQGGADPAVTAALTAFSAGRASEHAVLTALAQARLLVPVVAVVADELADGDLPQPGPQASRGGEKASEMAIPAIVGRDGRRALPAFTCLETLRRWQADARPVPVAAAGVWQSAVQESQAVIIDIAGPVPLAVEGARLAALADGTAVPRLHEDPDVRAAVAAAVAKQPASIRVRLGPPQGDADLMVELEPAGPATGQPVPDDLANAFADELAARLAGRLGRGIALVLRSPEASAPGGPD
jgi:SseB protein N-terminal domain